jgi:hypothetical protein
MATERIISWSSEGRSEPGLKVSGMLAWARGASHCRHAWWSAGTAPAVTPSILQIAQRGATSGFDLGTCHI